MSVGADPYPWPYDGMLDPRRLALVIAGDDPAWVARSCRAVEVAPVIEAVASAVRVAGGLVVHVRTRLAAGRPTWRPPVLGHDGWSQMSPASPGDLVIDAVGIDGFYSSSLDHGLRSAGIRNLVFAGYGAEAPVTSTLRSANDLGYECLTLTDAVAPFDPVTGHHSLRTITMSGGIFGAVAPAAALAAALRSLTEPTTMEAIR